MDDYFEDFGEGDFMDDSFEDTFDENFEPEDLANDGSGMEDEESDEICEDEFTANEALMFGVAMGFAYEEGLIQGKRRRLQREFERDQADDIFNEKNDDF